MTTALVTDMSQPLVPSAGNALEVIEVMEALTAGDLTTPLSRLNASAGGRGAGAGRAGRRCRRWRGADRPRAWPRARRPRSSARWWPPWAGRRISSTAGATGLPAARVMVDVHPGDAGHVGRIDTRSLGGGGGAPGRRAAGVQDDRIDLAVGLTDIARIGDRVDPTRPLARIHAASEEAARRGRGTRLRGAFTLVNDAPDAPPLIHERIA